MAVTAQRVFGYFLGLVAAALVLLAIYTFAVLSWSYSTGERSGYL